MKRILFIITLIIVTLLSPLYLEGRGVAKGDNLYLKYASANGAESVKVGRFLIGIGKIAANYGTSNDDEAAQAIKLLNNISSIEILDLSGCHISVKESFKKDISNDNHNGYELLTRIKDSDDDLRIFIKKEKNKIKEFLMVTSGEDASMIKIKGNMSTEEIINFTNNIKSESREN